MQETKERHSITIDEVLQQLWFCVTRNADDFVDAETGLLTTDIKKMSSRAKACIDGIEQVTKRWTDENGEEQSETTTKVKLTPKLGAVDLAMKHKGLFAAQQVEHTVTLDLTNLYASPQQLLGEDVPDSIEQRILEVAASKPADTPRLASDKGAKAKPVKAVGKAVKPPEPKTTYKVKELIEDE
jgi:hypothetical protein